MAIRRRYRGHTIVIEQQSDGTWLAWIGDRPPSPVTIKPTAAEATQAMRNDIDRRLTTKG